MADKEMEVYMVKCCKDKPLKEPIQYPHWLIPMQVGTTLTGERIADVLDNSGDNISHKNANYCELTALYWIWKNRLINKKVKECKYYGMFHYRRWLDIRSTDMKAILDYNIDAILPFPTIHEPDIRSHHKRYVREEDWDAMLQALKELKPDYYDAYEDIFSQEYLYNYNILIAKTHVLREYCEWLFPILERTEELSNPKGNERTDRYIGYLGENLLTLYFMYHKKNLNIVCTGKIMHT